MYPGCHYKTLLPCQVAKSVSNAAASEFNQKAMASAKRYADAKRNAKVSSLVIGDSVLVRQQKRNKLTSYYDPSPYKVVDIKGSMVTAERQGHRIVRNNSFFKQISKDAVPKQTHNARSPVRTSVATPQSSCLSNLSPDCAPRNLQAPDIEKAPDGVQAPDGGEAPDGEQMPIVEQEPNNGQALNNEQAPNFEQMPNVEQAPNIEQAPNVQQAPGDKRAIIDVQAPMAQLAPDNERAPPGVAQENESSDSDGDDFADAEDAVVAANVPPVAFFHPAQDLVVPAVPFNIPNDFRPAAPYNFRKRPEGQPD